MNAQNAVTIEIFPTIFSQMNAKNELAHDHKTSTITIQRLKHGHLRSMQKMSEEDQMHFLMTQLTGLSQSDLDELDIDDSAKLTKVIFEFMQGYMKIAKEMAR